MNGLSDRTKEEMEAGKRAVAKASGVPEATDTSVPDHPSPPPEPVLHPSEKPLEPEDVAAEPEHLSRPTHKETHKPTHKATQTPAHRGGRHGR